MAEERSIEQIMADIEAKADFAETLGLTPAEMAKMAQADLDTMTQEQKDLLLEALFEETGTSMEDAQTAKALVSLLVECAHNNVSFEDMLGVSENSLRLFKVSLDASPIPDVLLKALSENSKDIFIFGMITGMGVGAVWARRHGAE